MKKYKLIQRYPSLLPSWSSGMMVIENKTGYIPVNTINCEFYHFIIPKLEVESNPLFWEEFISTRNFEIYQLKMAHDGSIETIKEETYDSFVDIIEAGKYKYFSIYSVKRIIDGEIFKVGDIVKDYIGTSYQIDNFSIDKEGVLIVKSLNDVNISFIDNLNKLDYTFITEDGVEIYPNQSFYLLNTSTFKHIKCTAGNNIPVLKEYQKLFSKMETIEKYILHNKPCLSFIDVLSWATIEEATREYLSIEMLEAIVTEKLNKED